MRNSHQPDKDISHKPYVGMPTLGGTHTATSVVHIASRQIGTGFFHESKPDVLFGQASYYCEFVSQPRQLDRMTRGWHCRTKA